MPYRSRAQRAYLHIHHPEIAKRWDKEYPHQGKLPYHVVKHKLGVKGRTRPGDLLKAYKKKVVTKGDWYGETDTNRKTIKINKKRHKTHPLHKRGYPELADTIHHEILHIKHPRMHEKTIARKAKKDIKYMGSRKKKRLYRQFN